LSQNRYYLDVRKNSSVSAWLLDKYLEWQRKNGKIASLAEFARYLNVGDKALNTWINGRNNPSYKKAIQICEVLGDYSLLDILGYRKELPISSLPPELQSLLHEAVLEIEQALKEAGVQATSEEALKISMEILKKHGLSIESFEIEDDEE